MVGSHLREDTALLVELRATAERVATDVASLVRERRRGDVEVADLKSSAVDPVTEVDRAAEELARERLTQLRPDDGFLGEEGGHSTPTQTGVTWVVDPIDGTVNFLYGIPQYAVSVAAVDTDQQSLAGAVVNVSTGEVFSAVLGGGATLDGRPLRVGGERPVAQQLFLTGFQYQQHVRVLQGKAVARLVSEVRDIRRLGSAALDLCAVAAGTADAYVEEGLQLWDRAAGQLVATEAGARITILPGVGGMDCVVCAPAERFEGVVELVRACGFLAADEGG